MELLIRQSLKILLVSFLFIFKSGEFLRLQKSQIAINNKPENFKNNYRNLIANDTNTTIEKDIIRIQTIRPIMLLNWKNSKRKKLSDHLSNGKSMRDIESKIVNVRKVLPPYEMESFHKAEPSFSDQIASDSEISPYEVSYPAIQHPQFSPQATPKTGYVYEKPKANSFSFESSELLSQSDPFGSPIETTSLLLPRSTQSTGYIYNEPQIPIELFPMESNVIFTTTTQPTVQMSTKSGYVYNKPNTTFSESGETETDAPEVLTSTSAITTTIAAVTETTTITPKTSTITETTYPDKQTFPQSTTESMSTTTIMPSTKLRPSKPTVRPIKPDEVEGRSNNRDIMADDLPTFLKVIGANGRFDIRTLRVLPQKKRKNKKAMRKRKQKQQKDITEKDIIRIKA